MRFEDGPEPYPGYRNVKPIVTPLGALDHDGSYARYIDSLEPCPGCGRVDEMDNIEGKPGMLCAACVLAEFDDDDWDGDEYADYSPGERESEMVDAAFERKEPLPPDWKAVEP